MPAGKANFRWVCASALLGLELIRQGVGFGLTFREVARQVPDIEAVLPELPPIMAPVWLVAHRELQSSRRLRLVFDILAEVFRTGG